MPPQISISSFGCLSYGVRSNSNIDICVNISGVVVGRDYFSVGDAVVFVRGFLGTKFLMKVVNAIKMKPPEVEGPSGG
jgi:hypothetical protein